VPIPKDIVRISDTVWEIPVSHKIGMLVRPHLRHGYAPFGVRRRVFEQITNVATSRIVGHACCMPDGHWGTVSPSAASPRWTPATG